MKRARSLSSQGTQLVRSSTTSTYGKRSRAGSYGIRRVPKNSQTLKFTSFGFPTKLQVKHRYAEIVGLNAAAAAAPATYQWRANGMYDPNYTGTGHQPLYFDQLSTIYDHFTVVKSYIKLTLANASSTPATVCVFLNDDTTVTPATIDGRMEQSSARTIFLAKEAGAQVMYLKFDAYKVFGGSILGNDNLQGTSAADPVEQAIFTVSASSSDAGAATSVYCQAEIVYTAVWDETRDIAQS